MEQQYPEVFVGIVALVDGFLVVCLLDASGLLNKAELYIAEALLRVWDWWLKRGGE